MAARSPDTPVPLVSRRSVLVTTIAGAVLLATVGGQANASAPQGAAGTTSYDWSLTPAGKQTQLGEFPMNGVLSPDGRFLVVVNAGQGSETLQVVRVADSTVIQTVKQPVQGSHPAYFYTGISFNASGDTLYASSSAPSAPSGLHDLIRAYTVKESGGSLSLAENVAGNIDLPIGAYPAGLAVSGNVLYVAENLAGGVARVDLDHPNAQRFLKTGKAGQGCATQSTVSPAQLSCPYPLALALDATHTRVVVANQGESTVSIADFARDTVRDVVVGLHPNAVLVDSRSGGVFVSNGDSQSVSVLSRDLDHVEHTIDVKPFENAPPGSDPTALAISTDGGTLYVAEAGENAVAVVKLEHDGAGEVQGLIPTAWYPSTVVVAPQNRLLVLNAKGLGSGPNPGYQQGKYAPESQYIGSMMLGSMSTIDPPTGRQLADYSAQVALNNRFGDQGGDVGGQREADENDGRAGAYGVVPRRPGGTTPLKHVVYILKENRTFDQVFGDLGNGSNGDPGLTMFGQEITPNLHALAHQFVTLDNFYADAEISAQGHNWATQAQSNDYTEKNWLNDYTGWGQRSYDFEGTNTATSGSAGYLWNAARRANINFRNYGEFVTCVDLAGGKPCDAKDLQQPAWVATDPSLQPYTNPTSPGYTYTVQDITTPSGPSSGSPGHPSPSRYDAWHSEFAQQMAAANPETAMPTFEILRLPNDHTQGTKPGALTPQALVAQNDYAVGKVVDDISHSAVWKDTAVFITEDDAQDGPDHIDAHRTEALVISPYTQKATADAADRVDGTRYDTVSMLKTMELITGMQPLSRYDAAATPMLATFTRHAVLRPFTTLLPSPRWDGTRNGADAPMAQQSSAMNFDAADAAPSAELNQVLWNATMGDRPYPAGPW